MGAEAEDCGCSELQEAGGVTTGGAEGPGGILILIDPQGFPPISHPIYEKPNIGCFIFD